MDCTHVFGKKLLEISVIYFLNQCKGRHTLLGTNYNSSGTTYLELCTLWYHSQGPFYLDIDTWYTNIRCISKQNGM